MGSSIKTVAFIGASFGVGLSALKHTMAAGHQCVALCRTPSKLEAALPGSNPRLRIVQGNAHDVDAVASCLRAADGSLVDAVVTTIGAQPAGKLGLTVDDAHVCAKGMDTLLEALKQLRAAGATGSPLIVPCSTVGFSRFGRDVPLAMVPVYKAFVSVPGADKVIMEDRLVASGEPFTVVRPTHLVNGETDKPIRVGMEHPKLGRQTEVKGYTISREDTGRWIAQNLILNNVGTYANKIAIVTN